MLKKSLFVLLLGASSAAFACEAPNTEASPCCGGDSNTAACCEGLGQEVSSDSGTTTFSGSNESASTDASAPSTDSSGSSSDSSSGGICTIM